MTRVGFIGLGMMGAPMADNLMAAGHELFFFARRPEVVSRFREAGATACGDFAEVARSAEFVFTIVTADAQVEQVVTGPGGVIEGAGAGKMLIDMSTISPDTVRRVAARLAPLGMSMLDAPVSGGPSGARDGTLSIMVGGAEDDLRRAEPLLAALGKNIYHLGPLGSGQATKLVNQLLAGGVMTLIGEAMAVAKSAGLDLVKLSEAVQASSGDSKVFASRHRSLVEERFDPKFKCELMRKDVALAVDLARRLGVPTPVADVALRRYDLAIAGGQGARDFSIVAHAGVAPEP